MLTFFTNVLIALFKRLGIFVSGLISLLLKIFHHERTAVEELRNKLWYANTYEEWVEKAHELDRLLGNDEWREDPASTIYDYKLIESRLGSIRKLRKANDVLNMSDLLRAGLVRNLGGMNDVKLFNRSYLGTKTLIEEYTQEVVDQFEHISEIDFQKKLEFFTDARQAFGSSALVLYGGATFGLCHLGVVKALSQNGLLPRIISGTAIGALIAAFVCNHTDEELPLIFKPGGIDLGAFRRKDNRGNIRRKIARFLKHGYLLDVRVLEDCVKANVGEMTFEEAYRKTKRILNITVSSTRKFEVPQLLNYLTAPNVLIRSAALASAATTGIYEDVDLLCKSPQTGEIIKWAPSGVKWKKSTDSAPTESEYPFTRIAELFDVNHFIVSQAQPFVVPFIPKEPSTRAASVLYKCGRFISSEFRHRLTQLDHMRLLPKTFRSVVDDKLSGDVTIVPAVTPRDFMALLQNPTSGSLDYWMLKGEQSTWPYLALVKNRISIELILDRIALQLKAAALSQLAHPQPNTRKRNNSQ